MILRYIKKIYNSVTINLFTLIVIACTGMGLLKNNFTPRVERTRDPPNTPTHRDVEIGISEESKSNNNKSDTDWSHIDDIVIQGESVPTITRRNTNV